MSLFKQIENRWKKNHYSYPVIPNKAFHTETETSGEFCNHPPKYDRALTFVTVEDVIGGQVGFNHVLLNPMLSKEKNEQTLKMAHMFHFPNTPITDDDIDQLTSFDKEHLEDFIVAYRTLLHLA